ncbi:MAG: AAA family ATPase [Chitinophagales bacterium]|nr:AAA family ATPase [Bacteroidota bacterium]MCB9255828.1 AAA family ATPase [Chitinophagales bacterium]
MIIGITGTIGSGKDTLMELLKNEYGFKHFSVRQYLTEKLTEQGLEINRTNMTNLANSLREENHPAYIIEQLFLQAKKEGGNAVIESIRTPGEVDFLKEATDFHLFAVDADPNLRYERVQDRKSATDRVDFNTFMAEEQREMSNSEPHMQNIAACVRVADYKFKNNASIDMFYKKLRKTLEQKLEMKSTSQV